MAKFVQLSESGELITTDGVNIPDEAFGSVSASSSPAVLARPTAGLGTLASPFTHADGSGGIATAIAAAGAANIKNVLIRAGHYTVTTTIAGFTDGLTVQTEPGVVLVVDPAVAGGLAIQVEGIVSDYVEDVRIGALHLIRTNGGSVRFRYTRRCVLARVTATGGGGGLVSLRDVDRCTFDDIIGWNLDANSSGLNAHRMTNCQVQRVVTHGGAEAVDIFDSHRNQFAQIIAYSSLNEGVDMGSCTYNTFDEILVYGATTNGVSCKVEDGALSGGSFGNIFGKVVVIDQGSIGFDIGNGPATPNGTDVQNDNIVESLVVRSTVVGSAGARVQGTAANPLPARNQFRNVDIKVPSYGFHTMRSIDTMISGGYVESTGTYAVFGDTDTSLLRFKVSDLKIVGNPATSTGAVLIQNAHDPIVERCEILSSTGDGIRITNTLGARILDNLITECQFYGITLNIPDVAAWRGKGNHQIRRNRVRNVGKGGGTRYGIRVLQAGATAAESIVVEDNEVYDNQATKTSYGYFWSGTFDWCSFRRNRARADELVGRVDFSGTFGTNSVREHNDGYPTDRSGAQAAVGDNTNIAHGLVTTPTMVEVTGTVAGQIVSVTAMSTSSFTVAIKNHDGTAGTSQTVYWRARYV